MTCRFVHELRTFVCLLKSVFMIILESYISGCVEGVLLALSLSETFNMMDLFDKCLKWSIKHLKRVWPTKTFSQLSDKILKCFMKDVANSMVGR